MKFTSTVLAAASGSVAGNTFSRNRFGQYIRVRATPVNPATNFQETVRTIMNDLSNLWVGTLTQAQRDGWALYATNVPITNVIGQVINLTALNMYIRSNLARIQAGLARIDDAPNVFDVGGFTPVTITAASEGSGTMSIAFDDTDEWANEDDSSMLVWVSRPQNASINFFKGPYRFAGKIDGDGTTPPTSPAAITPPFAFFEGQKLFARVAVSRADGRYSFSQRVFRLAGA